MIDLRKILIIFIIATLFAVFVYSLIEAIHPSPQYNDFCMEYYPKIPIERVERNCTQPIIKEMEMEKCKENHGIIQYSYDEYGCPKEWVCETCQYEYDHSRKYHNFIVFIISTIFGLIAIALGLYLPIKENILHHWVGTGFMLGGLITLFIGTISYFADMGRFIRPIIVFIELIIVIYISYKKIKK